MTDNQSVFKQTIIDFPEQFSKALELSKDTQLNERFEHVHIAGMGGSAWPADLLATWLKDDLAGRLTVNRSYDLPAQLADKTLVIISSYSGNTEEPLSIYQQAKERGLSIAAVSSNGQLKELCQKDNIPLISIPTGLVPRMATGYLFTALYSLIVSAQLSKDKSEEILKMANNLDLEATEFRGENLAKKLKGKTPLIYTSERLKVLGYIFKIKLNEGVKIPAFNNVFPEMNHNEFSAFTDPEFSGIRPIVIILRDANDHAQIKKRMTLSTSIIESKDIPVETIELSGSSLLEKLFSTALLSDWTSFYLAQAYDIDPLSTRLQEDFKNNLR